MQSGTSDSYSTGETTPGTYTFYVRQSNSSGTCESEPHEISLVICGDSLATLEVDDTASGCPYVDLTDKSYVRNSTTGVFLFDKTDTIHPIEDSGVNGHSSYTATNYGGDTDFKVENGSDEKQAYLKFDLRGFLIIPFFQKTNIMNKMQGINFS